MSSSSRPSPAAGNLPAVSPPATHNEKGQPEVQPELTRHRLPTLFEVLSRRTLPPVDLFSFYIYMRDQQRAVDYLDFWLDVAQHMSLCRHYVRELRRSVLLGTPELERSTSKTASSMEGLGDMSHSPAGPSYLASEKEKSQDAKMSAFLREEKTHSNSPHGSGASKFNEKERHSSSKERPPRPSFMSTPQQLSEESQSPSNSHTVARKDIRASAQKILYTFLLPGSEREIILPHSITNDITINIEELGRDDPEVFDAAKDYVFQAMERDAFPGFLQMKALGNLVPASMALRLGMGLLALFGAFWAAFVLIFLDKSRLTRCWLILPFSVGVYLCMTHQYRIDPILALLHFSEYRLFRFSKIREPYIRYLMWNRSWTLLGLQTILTIALCVLFIFVPGKRL